MTRRLRNVRSYALYYGMGGEDELSYYDLAIVHPRGPSAGGVQKLKSRGALALAYVSVLEVSQQERSAPPRNTLLADGKLHANQAFGNWVLDPRSPLTRQRAVELTQQALAKGYDGVFLDCLDDVESPALPAPLRTELVPAAAWLVDEISRHQCVVVQNWGLHQLLPLTAHLIDGVCYEDFPYHEVGPVPSLHSGIRRLQVLQTDAGMRVLALNHSLADDTAYVQARDAAERCGFLWYGTAAYTDLPKRRQG